MGYYVIALLSTVCVTFLHKVCVVVIEWAFGLLLKLAHSKIKDEAKREELICTFRPQLKNMTLLGDSLVVIGLSAFAVFFVMNYAYALPMTLLAHKLAGIVASSANSSTRASLTRCSRMSGSWRCRRWSIASESRRQRLLHSSAVQRSLAFSLRHSASATSHS